MIFHNLITWSILVQMISNFNRMCRNSKFYVYVLHFFFQVKKYRSLDMKMLEHCRTRLRSEHLCENSLTMFQLQCRFEHCTKRLKRKSVCAAQKALGDQQYRKRWSKTCEIVHEIHINLNFFFKLGWWNLNLLNIKSFSLNSVVTQVLTSQMISIKRIPLY